MSSNEWDAPGRERSKTGGHPAGSAQRSRQEAWKLRCVRLQHCSRLVWESRFVGADVDQNRDSECSRFVNLDCPTLARSSLMQTSWSERLRLWDPAERWRPSAEDKVRGLSARR